MALLKQPYPKVIMNIKIKLAAVRVLIKELGLKKSISYGKELQNTIKKYKKTKTSLWDGLSPENDEKDRLSRNLIVEALILYKIMLNHLEKDRALEIIKKVIKFSAIAQLSSLIPLVKREEMIAYTMDERVRIMSGIVDQFPNSDWELYENTDDSISFKITRCRLVELVMDLGFPELKDAFCPGDAVYFEKYQKDLHFTRPKLIGNGDSCCIFNFSLKI